MKALVTVDETCRYQNGLAMLGSLKPTEPELELLHVIPTLDMIASAYTPYVVMDYDEMLKGLKSGSEEILDKAVDVACGRNLRATTISIEGSPAQAIAHRAEDIAADLVVVSAGPHGAFYRLASGSVSYNLACGCSSSLLVARCPAQFRGPVTAVFATDHSEFATKALDRLLSWNLKGLKKVVVLSAYTTEGGEVAYVNHLQAVGTDEVEAFIREKVVRQTEAVADRFRSAGITSESLVVRRSAKDAIHDAMVDTEAELLIVGAKGHSVWERMTLGSTALHQIVSEPYSVLVVRP